MTREVEKLIAKNRLQDRVFFCIGLFCTVVALLTLAFMVGDLAYRGASRIDWQFLTNFPSRIATKAGLLSALVGSLLVLLVTTLTAVPIGIGAAVYLEEYARKNWLTEFLEINIANLAGVPSIVYGLMALGLFVYAFALGQSILTAGLTLGCLVLPIIIVTTREALRTIPTSIREAAFSMGATKWQVVKHHLLPYSLGGIITGVIIALSRALGETAPLVTIGALTFIAFLPPPPVQMTPPFVSIEWLSSPFTVLPIQMFNWVSRPSSDFHVNAAAAGLVLLFLTLLLNGLAMVIRYHSRKRIRW